METRLIFPFIGGERGGKLQKMKRIPQIISTFFRELVFVCVSVCVRVNIRESHLTY